MLGGVEGWYWKGRVLDSHGIHGKISGASDSSTKVEEDAKVALGYVSSRVDQLLCPYGGFLKWWYPQIIHFHMVFPYFHHPFWGPNPFFGNTHIMGDKLINPIPFIPIIRIFPSLKVG